MAHLPEEAAATVWSRCGCPCVRQPLTTKDAELQLSNFSFSVLHGHSACVICDDSSIASPQTKFACIAHRLILCECSNCSTYDFEGQNLTQTSLKCVIVMKHGNFREP